MKRGIWNKRDNWREAWLPRVWLGCTLGVWLRLLSAHRFRFNLRHLPTVLLISLASVLNSLLAGMQWLIYGRRIARTPLAGAPLIIIGHWRTGTTWLHELLSLDQRHTYPNSYTCFFPSHFLFTESWIAELFSAVVPRLRPMDGMPLDFDRPQEDEFALCNLGAPSPYGELAFGNLPGRSAFGLDGHSARDQERWERSLIYFVRALTVRDNKRIVLKSPDHSFRGERLLKLFPNARFVHVVRDPAAVFPSTVRMWKELYRTQALAEPSLAGLEESVYATFVELHAAVKQLRSRLGPGRFCEVRYEDLVADPTRELHRMYEELELGDFQAVLPRIEEYLATCDDYVPNYHYLDQATREKIARRWRPVIEAQGYNR
jgi:omega-hydroxy-beta-dihydromenaquinone-9 sulfotransferase